MQSKISFSKFCSTLEVPVKNKKYKWIPLLFSDGPEQEKIRQWCYKENQILPVYETPLSSILLQEYKINTLQIEQWEERLLEIAHWFGVFDENEYHAFWGLASFDKRKSHANRVARLANELSAAMEEDICPEYFPIEQYFKKNNLPIDEINSLTLQFIDFNMPKILRTLADIAPKKLRERRREERPRTGKKYAVIFAKYMANQFELVFKKIPNDVIAACVCLKYPEIDPPPNEDTIRDWRVAK
jgi:hypothetical protein